jgi:hypothetical protein
MTQARLKRIFGLIAIAAFIIGFFALIGSSNDSVNNPIVAEQENHNLEQMVLDAERLAEIAPAAGPVVDAGELPSNSEVGKEIFDF